MANQNDTDQEELLEQQRVLAEFGDFALKTEAIDDILNRACELIGRALETDLAKLMELLPDGRTFTVRAGVGWRSGIIGEVTCHGGRELTGGADPQGGSGHLDEHR